MSINFTTVSKSCSGDGCELRWECERFHSHYLRERKPFEPFHSYAKGKNDKCRYHVPATIRTRELIALRVSVRRRTRERQ